MNSLLVEEFKALKLSGMLEAYSRILEQPDLQSMSLEEQLSYLLDAEKTLRQQKKQQRLSRAAKLKVNFACIENIDYHQSRGLDRSYISTLKNCNWVKSAQYLLITGATGVGKTWLGCAFGNQAIRMGLSVIYKRFPLLLEELEIAHRDGSLPKLRAQLAKAKLLILDDWGLAPMTTTGRHDLLEIVDERCGSHSLLITSQLPVSEWHQYIGEPTMADAILDRIVHRSHRIELSGGSMRKQKAQIAEVCDEQHD